MDMESKQTTFTLGSSLPVPCVQDLAKQSLTTVPSRYVRPDQHPLFISNPSSSSPTQVPVIDMEKLLSQEFMDSELDKFHNACKGWGFFQLINHGVSLTLMDALKLQARNFFNLPSDEKKRFCQQGDIEGYDQAFVMSEEQKLDWCDMMYMTTLPTHMRKPYLFPNLPLPLRKHTGQGMEPEITNLGSSIHVPCVQELAKESLTTVPQRYLRPDQDSPIISDTASLPQVPVVDMQRLFSQEFAGSELDKLHHACKEWGFFQLINHGVSTTLVVKIKAGIQEFFDLPMEKKKKYWQKEGEMEGFGQAFVVSEEQKLDWGDIFYMITLPHNSRKPHLFPKLPLPFRDNLEAYSEAIKSLALKILHLMAKALGMKPEEMKEAFEDGCQKMRMNYYPPCPQPELVMGLNSHSDGIGLAILIQVNDVEGLQIKKDGKWIPVKPLRDAFIINIGDILEVVTNGIYKSIEHRATVNSEKERISIATFYSPKLDGEMGPAPSLVTPETPAVFRKIGVADFFRAYFSKELNGKAYLDFMRIQNGEA